MKHLSRKVLTVICISLLLMSLAPRTAHGQQIDSASDIDISVIEGQQPILNSPGQLSAAGAVVIEQSTGKVLYGKYEDRRLYPASTTKILTALLAAEYGDLDETIVVGEEIFLAALDGSKAGLEENEEITLRDLVYGLLIHSGNDAANTIAVHIARRVSEKNLPVEEAMEYFANMMNERARKAGAQNSSFVNAHGYHDPGHYTTAYDLAMIGREAAKNEFFMEAVSTTAMNNTFWTSGAPRFWRSKNRLLKEDDSEYYEWATGGKTGYTSAAGQCLVTFASKDGLDLISVVLKSDPDMQWCETRELLEYGFSNFRYHAVLERGEIVETLPVDNYASDDWGSLAVQVSSDDWGDVFHKDDIPEIRREIIWEPSLLSEKSTQDLPRLKAPISKGQKIGELKVTLRGQVLKNVPLIAVRDVKRKDILDILTNQPGDGTPFGLSWLKFAGLAVSALALIKIAVLFIKRRRRRRHYTIFRRY